jgi:hypothetical protein
MPFVLLDMDVLPDMDESIAFFLVFFAFMECFMLASPDIELPAIELLDMAPVWAPVLAVPLASWAEAGRDKARVTAAAAAIRVYFMVVSFCC